MSADATTIFATSSGRPPAAIGIVRVSGPDAVRAATALAGSLPRPRRAGLRLLRDAAGQPLDRALVLVFPGPDSATGDDLVEFHCHGGRAVLSSVERALGAIAGLRPAEAGEFTRTALRNGRIDLAQAEGLADLLAAETEAQRRAALAVSEGLVSGAVRGWLGEVSMLAALVEAMLDFADEDDVAVAGDMVAQVQAGMADLASRIGEAVAAPPAERLRDGVQVVIAGPPNAGKSTLINLLADRDAAIVSPIAGTTRDRIEVPVARDGIPYVLSDTAGLAVDSVDPVERIGIARAQSAIAAADILLWLDDAPPPEREHVLWVHARSDLSGREVLPHGRHIAVARDRPDAIARLWDRIAATAAELLPTMDRLSLHQRQRELCRSAMEALEQRSADPLVLAEQLRYAGGRLAEITGDHATEEMLDALFGRFCVGK